MPIGSPDSTRRMRDVHPTARTQAIPGEGPPRLMGVRIAIFGSCVTRDLFEDGILRSSHVHYASRSSIISAVAARVALDEADVPLESAYQRRAVMADFNKTFFEEIEALAPDWVVVDLIDERFDVLRTGGSFVTESSAFSSAGLGACERFDFTPVRRLTAEASQLFDEATTSFAQRLGEIIPAERVILHRALWLTRYRRGDLIEDFPAPRAAFAERHNRALEAHYDAVVASLGGQGPVLGPDPACHFADHDHKWALEPFHYERAYNEWAVSRLREMVGI